MSKPSDISKSNLAIADRAELIAVPRDSRGRPDRWYWDISNETGHGTLYDEAGQMILFASPADARAWLLEHNPDLVTASPNLVVGFGDDQTPF